MTTVAKGDVPKTNDRTSVNSRSSKFPCPMSCESLDILPELAVGDDVPFQDLVGVGVDAWGAKDG